MGAYGDGGKFVGEKREKTHTQCPTQVVSKEGVVPRRGELGDEKRNATEREASAKKKGDRQHAEIRSRIVSLQTEASFSFLSAT